MDDTTFDDLERVDLEPFEMVLSMVHVSLKVPSDRNVGSSPPGDGKSSTHKPFLLIGTGYALPDEDEPKRGRLLVYSCQADETAATAGNDGNNRTVRQVTELSTQGAVYSICQFYEGSALFTINSSAKWFTMLAY